MFDVDQEVAKRTLVTPPLPEVGAIPYVDKTGRRGCSGSVGTSPLEFFL